MWRRRGAGVPRYYEIIRCKTSCAWSMIPSADPSIAATVNQTSGLLVWIRSTGSGTSDVSGDLHLPQSQDDIGNTHRATRRRISNSAEWRDKKVGLGFGPQTQEEQFFTETFSSTLLFARMVLAA